MMNPYHRKDQIHKMMTTMTTMTNMTKMTNMTNIRKIHMNGVCIVNGDRTF